MEEEEMREEEITWEDVIKLFQRKPELVENYLGVKINRDTLVTDYKLTSARGVRTDMIFADTEGRDYIVKINYKQSPFFGLRDVSLWAKRYAEDKRVPIMDIIPGLIIDEESLNSYHNIKELDRFKIKYAAFKVSDILKEFES
ncbi:MAG: hypothetical protein AUK23_12580 [Deltaproteobacteria bacterium CG2_30_43_15]|nr:MAG: hypothetical protein AUK23_12580 [Deltaproteobacteria bacterium CG2_30_43_15]